MDRHILIAENIDWSSSLTGRYLYFSGPYLSSPHWEFIILRILLWRFSLISRLEKYFLCHKCLCLLGVVS